MKSLKLWIARIIMILYLAVSVCVLIGLPIYAGSSFYHSWWKGIALYLAIAAGGLLLVAALSWASNITLGKKP